MHWRTLSRMLRVSALAAGTLLAALGTCGPAFTLAQTPQVTHSVTTAPGLLRVPNSPTSTTAIGPDRWFDGFALPVIDGDVRAILPWCGGIVIGGRFNQVGGILTSNIAFWDGVHWHSLAGGTEGEVYCLAEYRGDLIAAGTFESAGDTKAHNIARWNGSSWTPLGNGLVRQAGSTEVRALAVHENALIAGGNFDHSGETALTAMARWDGHTWLPFGESLDPVLSFCVFRDTLFAGRRTRGAAGSLLMWNGSA